MDHEALKEQWSEIEDRDGIRLSWNVFPSSRMVSCAPPTQRPDDCAYLRIGSFTTRGAHRCCVHTSEREARYATVAIRACNLQAAMSSCLEPLLVCWQESLLYNSILTDFLQPSRCSCTPLDLPILSFPQSTSTTLQGYYTKCYPS
jgi:hypothetical protein